MKHLLQREQESPPKYKKIKRSAERIVILQHFQKCKSGVDTAFNSIGIDHELPVSSDSSSVDADASVIGC
jgi:hypothetical protein